MVVMHVLYTYILSSSRAWSQVSHVEADEREQRRETIRCFICFLTGIQYQEGQPVYTERNTQDEWTGTFPDGSPFRGNAGRKPRYIYVWKTWGIHITAYSNTPSEGKHKYIVTVTNNVIV